MSDNNKRKKKARRKHLIVLNVYEARWSKYTEKTKSLDYTKWVQWVQKQVSLDLKM